MPEKEFELGENVVTFTGVAGVVTRCKWCDGMKALGVNTGGMNISLSPRYFYEVKNVWYDSAGLRKSAD